MNNSIMWSCGCGNDNFIVLEDTLEDNCVNEIEAECEACGECVILDINIRVLPKTDTGLIKYNYNSY